MKLLCCVAVTNSRESWCRVATTGEDGKMRFAELSWPLALRIVPRLLAKHGVGEVPGLWRGAVVRLK